MRCVRLSKLILAFLGSIFILWLCNRQTSNDHDAAKWHWNDKDVAIPIRSDKRQREYIDNRGIHVVVGRYVGDQLPGMFFPNCKMYY